MAQENMTVHEALAELKTLEKRIHDAINKPTFVYANKHINTMIDGTPIEKICEAIKSNFQKVNDLIKRHNAIKKAINLSNATTDITIGDKTYKVAEAIALKQCGMKFLEEFNFELITQLEDAQSEIRMCNKNLDKRADEWVADTYGNKDTNGINLTEKRQDFVTTQSYELVDPLGLAKIIAQQEEEIATFNSKIDAKLSISNAQTIIKIEY